VIVVYVARVAELTVIGNGNDPTPVLRCPARRRMIVAISALVLMFALGAAAGYRVRAETTRPPVQQSGPVGSASITAGARCAMQVGTSLWLGVEVINDGPGPVVLRSVEVRLPVPGGLVPPYVMWAACGQLSAVAAGDPPNLAERGTLWVSGVFPVTVACPDGYPVLFAVTYTDTTGAISESDLGFDDLQGVAYTGCA
jgi:hypothetical protein